MADDQNPNDKLSYDSDKGFFDNLATWAHQINSARDPDVMHESIYNFYRQHGYSPEDAASHASQSTDRVQSRMNRTGAIANIASYMNPISGPPRIMSDIVTSEGDPSKFITGTPMGTFSEEANRAKGYLGFADGGTVDKALQAVGGQQPDPVALAQQTLSAPRPALSKGQQRLMGSFQQENRPAAVVSPKPGTGSTEDSPGWSYATPDRPGEDRPPPVQTPVRDKPRLSNIADHVQKQMKTKGFRDLVRDVAGIHKMDVTPTTGSWMGQVEPSFIINGYGPNGEDASPAQIRKLSHLLGFGYQQDAVVEHHHNPSVEEGRPTMYVGKGRKLVNSDIDAIHAAAQNHGLDFTRTKDGMGVKFSHFGGEEDLPDFVQKVHSVAKATGMPDVLGVRTEGDLKYAKGYLDEIFRDHLVPTGTEDGSARSPHIFGRVVDHVLAPYARATAAEGYRLSPERLGEAYGLTPDEVNYVRKALYPVKGSDRSTVALMKEGPDAEQLDVRPTGKDGKPVVDDVLYALQNRAAAQGQIDPTDHSDTAKKMIAKNMADEVEHHVGSSDKSAIGWYDAELKKAKDKYAAIFPEIKNDPKKSLLFDTILGITSQGNDVHSNSVFAARLYNLVRDGKMSLKDATQEQAGTMGEQTKAIEYNLHKLHHLLENNSPEELSNILDKKQTVSQWKKQLKEDKNLHNFDGEPLDVKGRADQKVTGWSVFGPKIGSFINNLRGDYSTLTADLWFSRSWNRLLGHNFLHTPLQEAAQYRDFRDAMHAEYAHHHPDEVSPIQPHKTRQGEVVTGKDEQPASWLHGPDMKNMSADEFNAHMNDPELMLEKAKEIYDKYSSPNKETGKGAFSEKSDLRRRAKNWIESRYNPVAAPRSDQERGFQQDTAEEAQKMLKKRGIDISIADIQAALWYHEKDLFGKYGVAGSRQAPASYSDAADKAVQLHQSGRLYDNWSDIQKEIKASQKAARDEERAKLKAEKDAQKAAEKAAKAAAKAKPIASPEDGYAIGGEVEGDRPFDYPDAQHFADGGAAMSPPKKTIKAYKLFRTDPKKPGQLFPLFVDAKTPVPIGKWVAAKAGDPGKTEGRVKSTLGDLAYRPGWHAGDLPIATHIGGKSDPRLKAPDYRPDNQVWAEVEHPADVDWQSVANGRMQFTKDGRPKPATAHITDQVPLGGFYRYKTNPNMTGNWIISGGMKVNRILGDDEVQAINDAAGAADLPRLSKSYGGAAYPLDKNADEHLHSGGHMTWMSPDTFLDKAQKMRGDSGDKHAIKHFEKRMEQGDKLNALALYPKGGQDGRHRATAAKHEGIKKIPVVQWPKKRAGGSIVERALMLTSKKA